MQANRSILVALTRKAGAALLLSGLLVAAPAVAQDGGGMDFGAMDLGSDDDEGSASEETGDLELAPIPAEGEQEELDLAPIPAEPEAADAGPTEADLADAPSPQPAPARPLNLGGPFVGVKVGAGFGQPFGPFGAAFSPEIEIGYGLDFGLAFFVAGQWQAPVTEGTVPTDPRLPNDGVMSYELTRNELVLTLGALYRIPVGGPALRPYASLGPRLYLLRTDVVADGGGEDFGPNEETATDFGLQFALGAELVLGPGALVGEVQLGYAPVDGMVLRDTSTGSLGVNLGYRLLF